MAISGELGQGGVRRRSWRRLERQARARFERELLGDVRRLAAGAAVLEGVEVGGGAGAVVRLRFATGTVTLAPVHPVTAADLVRRHHEHADVRLADAGRYGRYWWIQLRAGAQELAVTGSHLQVRGYAAGAGAPEAPQVGGLVPLPV